MNSFVYGIILCFLFAEFTVAYNIPISIFSTPLTKAAAAVILKFFTTKTTLISISRASSTYERNLEQSDIVNDILHSTRSNIVYRLEPVNITSRVPITSKRRYNVIFIDCYESFREIFTPDTIRNYDVTGYYLLIVTTYNRERPLGTIEKIFKWAWASYILNINVLLMNPDMDKSALMYTFHPFTEHKCDDTTPVIANIFVGDRFIQPENFYPSKIRNMHQCPLYVATFSSPPFMLVEKTPNGSFKLSGFESFLIKTLATRLNFDLIIQIPKNNEQWGEVFRNGSMTGAIRMVAENESNLTIGAYGMTQVRSTVMDTTLNYFQSDLVLVIPPGQPYTPFEKLFLPFEPTVWLLIAIQFGFGLLVIIALKFVTKPVRNFIIGRHNTNPMLNMMAVFLGGPLGNVPGRNFARTLAMIWLLGCLVIRGSYQGKLFNYLQVQKNFSTSDTIEKMLANNFRFYVTGAGKIYFDSMPNVIDRVVTFKSTQRQYYWDQVRNPEFKGALLSSRAHVAYANYQHSHEDPYMLGSDQIMLFPVTLFVQKGSYLTKQINNELSSYMSAGLIDFWKNSVIDDRYLKSPKTTRGPVKMSFNHIAGGYQICMIFYLLSVVIFGLELLSRRYVKLQKLFEFLTY